LDQPRQKFNQLSKDHNPLEPVAFDKLLKAFVYARDTDNLVKYFKQAKDVQVKPTVNMYNTVLLGLMMEGSLEKMTDMVKEMRSAGVNPDPRTYDRLIRAYSKKGDSVRILGLFTEMKKQGIFPTWQTLKVLLGMKTLLTPEDLKLVNSIASHVYHPKKANWNVSAADKTAAET